MKCDCIQCSSTFLAVFLSLALVLSPISTFAVPQQDDRTRQLLEHTGQAFIQAEVQSYLVKFANQRPPISGMKGFGSSTMFAVQLLFAADSYVHAHNDKERFAAVQQGAAAYLAYAYAATPAVGVAVTVVVVVTQIIQANIANSYAEAILAIYRDIQESELRIADLKQRMGEAEMLRFVTLLDDTQRIIGNLRDVDKTIQLDCSKKAADFDSLSNCLTLTIQTMTVREQLVHAIARILDSPDSTLALLSSNQDKSGAQQGADAGKAMRKQLEGVAQDTSKQLSQMQESYKTFVQGYTTLAVSLIFDEALAEPQRLEGLNQVKHQCLLDQTKLSHSATQLVFRITQVRSSLALPNPKDVRRQEVQINNDALSLLENFEQRRIACPAVENDADLSSLMEIVRERLKQLPLR